MTTAVAKETLGTTRKGQSHPALPTAIAPVTICDDNSRRNQRWGTAVLEQQIPKIQPVFVVSVAFVVNIVGAGKLGAEIVPCHLGPSEELDTVGFEGTEQFRPALGREDRGLEAQSFCDLQQQYLLLVLMVLRLQAPGSRLQALGSRLQAPGSRLQAPGSRLLPGVGASPIGSLGAGVQKSTNEYSSLGSMAVHPPSPPDGR